MRFRLKLVSTSSYNTFIPINYQYALSACLYHIVNKADTAFASFLHSRGYGKGFKLFCFSELQTKFKVEQGRFILPDNQTEFDISFYVPEAAEKFITGLFASQVIEIADKTTKASFTVQSVSRLPDALEQYSPNQIIKIKLCPLSPIVAGLPNERGNYDFLSPNDVCFNDVLLYNWRNKIEAYFGEQAAAKAMLLISAITADGLQAKSRLITIKSGTDSQTKIRGFKDFGLTVTAERQYIDLLLDAGVGQYNAQGMGFVTI